MEKIMNLSLGTVFMYNGQKHHLLAFYHKSGPNKGKAKCCTHNEYLTGALATKQERQKGAKVKDEFTYIELDKEVNVIKG